MSPKIHQDRSEGQQEPSFSAPPPSYSEATVPGGSQAQPPIYKQENGKPAADPIDELVSRLPSLVRERQRSQASRCLSQDDALVQHMTPLVRDFLLDFSTDSKNVKGERNSHDSLSVELVLVPQDAAPSGEGWELAGLGERREQCAFFRLDEVAAPGQLRWASKNGGSVQVRDGAAETDLLWWRDEEHALRLASALRGVVAPERSEEGGAQRREVVGQQVTSLQPEVKGKSPVRSFFGLSRRSRQPVEPTAPKIRNKTFATDSLGSVRVEVQAEEVTFRRENDFGLWESASGWAIVIKTTVSY